MQWTVISEGVSLTPFGYHIKSKHDVFSDGTEQKCLCFSHVFSGFYNCSVKERVCHIIATQKDMNGVSFKLSYAILTFKSSNDAIHAGGINIH